MKIYHDGVAIIGAFLPGIIANWIKKAGKSLIISEGPPIGEWYAPEAKPHKPIDKQITDHVKRVIEGKETNDPN